MKTLKPNRNNIETFLPVFKGFYGSYWDLSDEQFDGESEHFNLPKNFPFYDYINYSDYNEAISQKLCDFIESRLSDFIEVVQYQSLYSPKEYNFTNNSINCIIRPKKEAIRKYIYDNKEEFQKYLTGHFKSRDGFISFYGHSFEEWEQEYTKGFKDYTGNSTYLGHVLDFIGRNEGIEQIDLYYATDDISYSQFYNEEFYNLIRDIGNEASNFVKDNYTKFLGIDIVEAAKIHFEDHENIDTLIEVVKETVNEIESKTLKLAI